MGPRIHPLASIRPVDDAASQCTGLQVVVACPLNMSLLRITASLLRKLLSVARVPTLAKRLSEASLSERDKQARAWIAAGHDRTLRLDYDLREQSVVFDLGGYEGQWTSDIYSRYRCTVVVFEPVRAFAQQIRQRFERNPSIEVFTFGLSNEDRSERIVLAENASSTGRHLDGTTEQIELVDVQRFVRERDLGAIDLMKVNIEGGEYDLLDRLIDTGLIEMITDLQVQFHDFAPGAARRMHAIQVRLAETHAQTYGVEFVWENWHRR